MTFNRKLNENYIQVLKNEYNTLSIDDYENFPKSIISKNIEYKGWSIFFSDYVKIHIVFDNKYYDFCVMKDYNFENNVANLEKGEKMFLTYYGKKINSNGMEYPILSISYPL